MRLQESLNSLQHRVTQWGIKCFGAAHMAAPEVRGLRLLEEAIEFAQSANVPVEKCQQLVAYVYSRPVGKPEQELGGVFVTLLAACSAIGMSAENIALTEIERCESKTPDHFAKRNRVKLDAGFGASQ